MDFLRRFGLRGITASIGVISSIGRGLPVRLSSFLLDIIPLVALSCTFGGATTFAMEGVGLASRSSLLERMRDILDSSGILVLESEDNAPCMEQLESLGMSLEISRV